MSITALSSPRAQHSEVSARSNPSSDTEFMSNQDSVGVSPHYYKQESDGYEAGSRRGDKPRVSNLDGAGDTIMGGVNTSGVAKGEFRRALLKSKSKIEKLRSKGNVLDVSGEDV